MSLHVGATQVSLIDTPGHSEFVAEVERALTVLDGAVLVVSAVEGVQSHTRILVRALERMGIPFLIFVNKIDRVGASYDSTMDALRAQTVVRDALAAAGTVVCEPLAQLRAGYPCRLGPPGPDPVVRAIGDEQPAGGRRRPLPDHRHDPDR